MLDDIEIEKAKAFIFTKSKIEPVSEHNDCVRMAYEWLDAQNIIKRKTSESCALKHFIEAW